MRRWNLRWWLRTCFWDYMSCSVLFILPLRGFSNELGVRLIGLVYCPDFLIIRPKHKFILNCNRFIHGARQQLWTRLKITSVLSEKVEQFILGRSVGPCLCNIYLLPLFTSSWLVSLCDTISCIVERHVGGWYDDIKIFKTLLRVIF